EKAKAVVVAAEAEPKKYSHLVEDMDRTGVDGAYRQLKIAQKPEPDRAKPPPRDGQGWCPPKGTRAEKRAARAEWEKAEIERIRARGKTVDERRARVAELENEKCRLEIKIADLESKLEEAKTARAAHIAEDNGAGSPEERWQRSLSNIANKVILLPASWTCEFGDWGKFRLSQHLLDRARDASVIAANLTKQLSAQWSAKLSTQVQIDSAPPPPIDDGLDVPEFLRRKAPQIGGDRAPVPESLQRKPKVTDACDSRGGVPLRDAVTDAFNKFAELGYACREAFDNAPEGLNQSPRNQTLDETASALEDLSAPVIPAELAEIKVNLPKPRKPGSRGDRRNAAVGILAVCTEVLSAIDESDGRYQAARDLCDELQGATAEAENCVFPGMYQ